MSNSGTDKQLVDMDVWDRSVSIGHWPDLSERKCFIGLDCTTSPAIVSMAVLYEPLLNEPWLLDMMYWCKMSRLSTHSLRGANRSSPINITECINDIDDVAKSMKDTIICGDGWSCHNIRQQLSDRGNKVIEDGFSTEFTRLRISTIQSLVESNKLRHCDDLLLRHQLSLAVRSDSGSNKHLWLQAAGGAVRALLFAIHAKIHEPYYKALGEKYDAEFAKTV